MKRWLQSVVVVWLVAAPGLGAATEPEPERLPTSWVMDAPVTGEHAVSLIREITVQVDQRDFSEGEWRTYKIGVSDVTVTLALLHRYDDAASDFPTPPAGAEEWSLQLTNRAYSATIEWTTVPGQPTELRRVYTRDDRLHVMPRSAQNPRVATQAALQHARLDAMHPHASLVGILRGGYPVWQPVEGEAFKLAADASRLPRLLITSSGYNQFRSALARDAAMGPACIGWQVCGETRGAAARK